MHNVFLSSSYFSICLTLIAYAIGVACQKKWKSSILNPILISAILIILVLTALDIPNAVYQEGCKTLSFLLTPATICLAIAFYEQFQQLKAHLVGLILGVLSGAVSCLGSVYLLAGIFDLDRALTISLLPKSITTAIGVGLSEEIGGIAAITTAVIILTGITGNILGPVLCRLFRIQDPIAQGVAFGTASHVVGTSKAVELGELAGAVSGFALTAAGLITAVILSFFAQFI